MVELLAGSKFNLSLTPFYTPLHSLSILLFTVLLYLLSTPPFYIPSLHSFFNPSLLPPSHHLSQDHPSVKRPPPKWLAPFHTPSLHSLSILLFTVLLYLLSTAPFSSPVTRPSAPPYGYSPFDTPNLHSFSFLRIFLRTIKYCCKGAAQLPLCFPLYILNIVGYCDGTAQSPLGSPPVTRQPSYD